MSAYYDYLDRHGLIYDAEHDLMRASALEISYDGNSYEFNLKDGAVDRRYGDGVDSDLDDRGLNPVWG
jgi:hypothetical protein